jgi:TetR/AcrR family transcriptional regulator, regulator of autoinduction and epiphytic fitness
MGLETGEATAPLDGRRARRERGRLAVIDAMLSLLQDGKVPVSADMVAERAGVSVASVFRYFDGLVDLQLQTFERFRERFEPLLEVEPGTATLHERIAAFVGSRLELYEQAGAIMAVGRLRALEHEPMVAASAEMRGLLAGQVQGVFEPDVAAVAAGSDLVAVIDALASLESWDVMRKTHSRSRREIECAWRRGIEALIAAWAQPDEGGDR